MFPALKRHNKNFPDHKLLLQIAIDHRFCVDSLTHPNTLAKAKKMATPPKTDGKRISDRIDQLIGRLYLPSPEADAVDFLERNLQSLVSGESRADPMALLDLIEARIARRAAFPVT